MKVLFWLNDFPLISETFIRDQIVYLLYKKIQVNIYVNDMRNEQRLAIKDFEKHNLLDKRVDRFSIMPENKFYRICKAIYIIVASVFSNKFKFYIRSLNINKYGAESKSLLLLFKINFILKNDIRVIHAHFGPNGSKAIVFKKIGLPIKIFTTFHGYDIRLGLEKGAYIYTDLFRYADGIFSISNYNRINLLKLGADANKILLLENGIDCDFYNRIKPLATTGKLKIITVARLVEEKALHIAIQALALLHKEMPKLEFEYNIIGDGNKREALQQLIITLGLSEQIKLLGAKNSCQVKDLMIQSDLFLLSSQSEALPTVLLEAQSAKLIILATNVGSVKAMVKGGLVVEPLNSVFFKNGLMQLLKNRKDWNNLANLGRLYVLKKHNIINQTNKLIRYYES